VFVSILDSSPSPCQVVTAYQQPKHCNGKHNFSFTFTVVDPLCYPPSQEHPSSKEASEPVVIQCFADTIDSFPPIRRVGDLIRLHRCNLQMYQSRPQILWFHQKSSYLLFSHPLSDELIGLPSESIGDANAEEMNELELQNFSSSATYHLDERVERDYIRFLSVWRVSYFISTGYTDHPSIDPNKLFHVSLRRMKETISSLSTVTPTSSSSVPASASPASMDFIGMFVGLFPLPTEGSPPDNQATGTRYLYVWDGSCEGGIYSSDVQLPNNFQSNEYLKTSENVYRLVELSVKVVSKYNETIAQLLAPVPAPSSISSSTPTSSSLQMDQILTALQQSLSRFVSERSTEPSAQDPYHALNRSRYLPGGFGILAIPVCCTPQIAVANSLQPGTWIRARKIVSGSVEEVPILGRDETISARFTAGSAINVLPPFHWFVFILLLPSLVICALVVMFSRW
jgi:hypothetical protein